MQAPTGPQPSTPDEILAAGDQFWPLRAFRELDDALLRLRFNEPEIGTVVIRTEGDRDAVLAVDATLAAHQSHWLVREIILLHEAHAEAPRPDRAQLLRAHRAGLGFAGSLFELALAADRSYMLDDRRTTRTSIALSPMNGGPLPMSNGLTRLQTRFLGEPAKVDELLAHDGPFNAARGATRPASSPSRPTRSTGTTRCGWPSRRARRSRPTR